MTDRSNPEKGVGPLLSRLSGDRYNAYLDHPVPSDTDDDVDAVLDAYLQADSACRAEMLSHTAGEPCEVLEVFAQRQAVLAVRTRSLEPIRRGLLAEGLAFPHGDYRYVLMGLAKLDYSARLLGTDLVEVYRNVASVLPEASRSFIESVLANDDRGESFLKGMGYAPRGTGADFTYANASPWDDDDE